jgi:hypothetical protein
MSAQLVNAVGIIGFIGLFAPLLAKMLGARRLAARLIIAPVIGALLLWLTDQVMQTITTFWMEIPTGAATALVGAPLLLWLLPRLRNNMTPPPMDQGDHVPVERQQLGVTGARRAVTRVDGCTDGRTQRHWLELVHRCRFTGAAAVAFATRDGGAGCGYYAGVIRCADPKTDR